MPGVVLKMASSLSLTHGRQAPLRQHRVREFLARRHRVAAQLAGRVDGILGLQGARDLADRDVELRQRVGIDPEPDGVLRGAEDLHLADAGDARIGSLMLTYA